MSGVLSPGGGRESRKRGSAEANLEETPLATPKGSRGRPRKNPLSEGSKTPTHSSEKNGRSSASKPLISAEEAFNSKGALAVNRLGNAAKTTALPASSKDAVKDSGSESGDDSPSDILLPVEDVSLVVVQASGLSAAKRPRGRPPLSPTTKAERDALHALTKLDRNAIGNTGTGSTGQGRGRGRPRTHPPKDPNAPPRKRGRPRKHPPKDPNAATPRKRGRPPTHPPTQVSLGDEEAKAEGAAEI